MAETSGGLSKAEKHRRKREEKKAQQAAPFYCLKAERQDAEEGKGQGMFALEDISKGSAVVCASPALAVIFDVAATKVCAFCFRHAQDVKSERNAVLKRGPNGGFGVLIDGSLITGFASGSVNEGGSLAAGDILKAVDGKAVSPDVSAVSLIKASSGETLQVSLEPLRRCHCCNCLACCPKCAEQGALSWHQHECEEFLKVPENERKGDTSVLRMLLRYRALQVHGDWAGPEPPGKEPLAQLATLQASSTAVPALRRERWDQNSVCSGEM
eukprot:TRINITY_DN47016_c0_g1_i1.p1 TRINITY_DN47016_c0_g1~~TRINITY_DN47016_c0_g1_i1.p1  ORF type:complete len:280 (+),score=50.06 TRINITY_DN47016_c0_g1_i1:31-840(+)